MTKMDRRQTFRQPRVLENRRHKTCRRQTVAIYSWSIQNRTKKFARPSLYIPVVRDEHIDPYVYDGRRRERRRRQSSFRCYNI